MRWLKGDLRKSDIAIIGVVLLLTSLIVVFALLGSGHQAAQPGQATGTITTETAKEQLLKLQRDNERSLNAWFWNSGAALLSTLVIVIGGLFALWRWRVDRRDAQDKELKAQAEERFKTAVTALGGEKEGIQVGGAILLRSFLHKEDKKSYERYYVQIFDLAVAYLRLPRTSHPSEDPDGISHPPEDQNAPLPLTALSQALIAVFKEAFPLARSQNKGSPESLDASRIQLDQAYLWKADLKQAWMPEASLRGTDLSEAKLSEASLWRADLRANLWGADLSKADLGESNLSKADLSQARLHGAKLSEANLSEAKLIQAYLCLAMLIKDEQAGLPYHVRVIDTDLSKVDLREAKKLHGAKLIRADLRKANLRKADLRDAKLIRANLSKADLSGAKLHRAKLIRVKLYGADLNGANIEDALSLEGTNLRRVKGLTKEQLEACKAKGAIIDEDTTASSSQSPVSPPPPSESNDVEAPSVPSAQASTPPPDTDGSNTTTSKPSDGAQAPSAPSVQGSIPTPNTGSSAASSKPDPES